LRDFGTVSQFLDFVCGALMLFAMGFQLLLPRHERTSNKRKPGKQSAARSSARYAAKNWERSWGHPDGKGGDGKGGDGKGSGSTGVS
jgi:hypothetical protein